MRNDFVDLIIKAFSREAIKKIVFSQPYDSDIKKVSGRLCAHRGKRILALEYSLPNNTVAQKNVSEGELSSLLYELVPQYRQVNLITKLGDAELKANRHGECVLLGGDKLRRKLENNASSFESAIEALDKKKSYILSGNEPFLIKLGISDSSGRVHDKKQGKFRQINRFLEHIDDIYGLLDANDEVRIYDLCCGKSYLSFAVYHYLTNIKHKRTRMLCIDLKSDVISWCDALARELNFSGMKFICDDIKNTPNERVDMVISLHACDIATDIVLQHAAKLGAKVILSTPCCHRYINDKVKARELDFVTRYPHLAKKLNEALTDALRLMYLRSCGYCVAAKELTDPTNTPKNTLLCAIYDGNSAASDKARQEYTATLGFLLGEDACDYLKEIR